MQQKLGKCFMMKYFKIQIESEYVVSYTWSSLSHPSYYLHICPLMNVLSFINQPLLMACKVSSFFSCVVNREVTLL